MTSEERKQRHREASARFRAAHPERARESHRAYEMRNPGRQLRWRKKNPESALAIQNRANNQPSFKEYQKRWRAENPDKVKVARQRSDAKDLPRDRQARYRAKDPITARAKNTRQKAESRAKNPRRAKQIAKAWRLAHPEYQTEWLQKNPDAGRIRSHNRRARKKANGGKLSRGLANLLLAEQGSKCPYCRDDLTVIGFHMDHYLPLALGGKNEDWNIQLTCPTCNLSKGDKHPASFLAEALTLQIEG